MCSSGVFVIGLIVPSNAPVFVGGEAANGVAASPFVQGRSASHHHSALGAHIEYSSSCHNPEGARVGPCIQRGSAGLHHLRGEHGFVHWLPNPVRTGRPEPDPENLPKSNKVGSPRQRAALLLALHLSRLYESRRGTARWWASHGRLLVRSLTLQTVFSYLVSASVTFGGITWSTSLFGSTLVSAADFVAVCIFYTHIRFMKGMCSDSSVKPDVHTRRQVLRLKGSHEMTSLTRPNSNPGLPGLASSQLVLLCFSRVLIRSFTAIIRHLKELTL